MEPKLAYIDYTVGDGLMVILLRERGIVVVKEHTLDEFLANHDLNQFQALLYHPGVNEQPRILEVVEKYPKIKLAIVTNPFVSGDYPIARLMEMRIPIFFYNMIDDIEKFIRTPQEHVSQTN